VSNTIMLMMNAGTVWCLLCRILQQSQRWD